MNSSFRNKAVMLLFCQSLMLTTINAQVVPEFEWGRCYGGSDADYCRDMITTIDHGYLLTGDVYSTDWNVSGNNGSRDLWLVKTDSNGMREWEHAYGGTDDESGSSIQPASDGGYVIAGSSSSNNGDVSGHHGPTGIFQDDVWVIKITAGGALQWQKSFGGTGSDVANSITRTSDGGYAITGYTFSTDGDVTGNKGGGDLWVIRIDSIGNILWQKTFGGSSFEQGNSIIQTEDGGYAVAGYSFSEDGDIPASHGLGDAWVIRTDANGNLLWQNSLGGSGTDLGYSIVENKNGTFTIAGFAFSDDGNVHGHHGLGDCWLVWVDAAGNYLKDHCYGGSSQEQFNSIQKLNNGTYLVCGDNSSSDGDASTYFGAQDYWVLNIDSNASILWEVSFGSTDNEFASKAFLSKKKDLIIAGSTSSTGGEIYFNHGDYDYWLVKAGSPGPCPPASNLSVHHITATSAVLSWNPVRADYFKVAYKVKGSGEDWVRADDNIAGPGIQKTHVKITGLMPETTYTWRVASHCTGLPDVSVKGEDFTTDQLKASDNLATADQDLHVFPNPTNGDFSIYFNSGKDEYATASIQVINMIGQIVYAENISVATGALQKEIRLNPSLTSGLYSIRLMANLNESGVYELIGRTEIVLLK